MTTDSPIQKEILLCVFPNQFDEMMGVFNDAIQANAAFGNYAGASKIEKMQKILRTQRFVQERGLDEAKKILNVS